jgi:hypothetical protein
MHVVLVGSYVHCFGVFVWSIGPPLFCQAPPSGVVVEENVHIQHIRYGIPDAETWIGPKDTFILYTCAQQQHELLQGAHLIIQTRLLCVFWLSFSRKLFAKPSQGLLALVRLAKTMCLNGLLQSAENEILNGHMQRLDLFLHVLSYVLDAGCDELLNWLVALLGEYTSGEIHSPIKTPSIWRCRVTHEVGWKRELSICLIDCFQQVAQLIRAEFLLLFR